uniref:Uncharacterized protein n=1 Tax=viral metagenome TaxID=1070528 RepID=A0A6C0JDX1_9ZZZZ
MKISKSDLEDMYKEHLESERLRLLQLLEEEKNSIIMSIIEQNKYGKKMLSKKYIEYTNYNESYFQTLISHLQEIFVDSKIWMSAENTDTSKHLLLNIDWS